MPKKDSNIKTLFKFILGLLSIILIIAGLLFGVPMVTAIVTMPILALFKIYVPTKVMFWTVWVVMIIGSGMLSLFSWMVKVIVDLIE